MAMALLGMARGGQGVKPWRRATHFFFFAGFSALSAFLDFSGLLSAAFADFLGSGSFLLYLFSAD
jgi:hypothetical protein